jgi:hypothetical protein
MSHAHEGLLEQLAANSAPYHDPLARLDWSALAKDGWWLPPDALSLSGVAAFEAQPEAVKRCLSRLEFTGFIHSGIWLESIFIERIARSLRGSRSTAELAYNLHEMREECGHSLMFLKLMETSGLHPPGLWSGRPWLADMLGRRAPVDSLFFWAAVVVGEEIPDKLNRHIRNHGREFVDPVILQMCTLHVIDEARHIAHARESLKDRLTGVSAAYKRLLTPLIQTVLRQFSQTFYLPAPEVYEMAGLGPGSHWARLARTNGRRQAFMQQCASPTLHLLREHGFPLRDLY